MRCAADDHHDPRRDQPDWLQAARRQLRSELPALGFELGDLELLQVVGGMHGVLELVVWWRGERAIWRVIAREALPSIVPWARRVGERLRRGASVQSYAWSPRASELARAELKHWIAQGAA